MINSKPNNSKYHQGNFIPNNKDKVIKLNSEGGIYYRSGLEYKLMVWLDSKKEIKRWCGECMKVPYQMTHYEKGGDINLKNHTYYPDFYYELEKTSGQISKVICEVKPQKEYEDVILFEKKLFEIPQKSTPKKLKNLEYRLKQGQKNSVKWKAMIKYCDKKGFRFIVITEMHLKSKKFN